MNTLMDAKMKKNTFNYNYWVMNIIVSMKTQTRKYGLPGTLRMSLETYIPSTGGDSSMQAVLLRQLNFKRA